MNDITRALRGMESGEPRAAEQLLTLAYEELRWLAAAKMARERPGHTLQPTALVHEAWLRMGGDLDARIFAGIHFRFADGDANELGTKVAHYILANACLPLHGQKTGHLR